MDYNGAESKYSVSSGIAKVEKKRAIYLKIAIAMFGFAIMGVAVSFILEEAEKGWFPWLPINFGTYGISGISSIYLILLILAALATFVYCIRSTGLGLLASAVAGVFVFGVGFTIFEKVLVWIYRSFDTSIEITILGMTVNGAVEIPVSGTLGGALLNTVLYTVPFMFCLIRTILLSCKVNRMRTREIAVIDAETVNTETAQ